MIVFTCPECGGDLQYSSICTYPPIHVTECPVCGWREEKMEKIERISYPNIIMIPHDQTIDESLPKDELYSKADMIDMLTELQQEIEENVLADDPDTLLPFLQARDTCAAVIQQKINDLRKSDNEE